MSTWIVVLSFATFFLPSSATIDEDMDFTEPYRHSHFLTLYSPNGKYLASYHLAQEGFVRLHPSAPVQPNEDGGRGVIIFRFAATMQIVRMIEIRLFRDSLPTITEIGWSPDSSMLLAACCTTGTILVYSVEEEEFKATITVPGIGQHPSTTPGYSKHQSGKQKNGESKQMKELKAMGYTPPGAEILRGVRFSADSRHIVVWENQLLRLSIWSLESSADIPVHSLSHQHRQHPPQQQQQQQQHAQVLAMERPKSSSRSSITSCSVPPYSTLGTTATSAAAGSQYAYSVRGDLQYLAVITRNGRECKDQISIFATESYWTKPPIFSFGIAAESHGGIKDAEGIVWSPDGRYLVVWENPIIDFKVAVYSMDGRCVGSYMVTPEDSEPFSNGAHQILSYGGGGMGVKSVCWHPRSKLLALGGYDQKIRLLNHSTWKSILEIIHPTHIKYGPDTVLWRESESTVPVQGSVHLQGGVEYIIVEQPAVIPTVRVDTHKPNAKTGVGWCDFNSDGTMLASRNDNMPNVLWIWSMNTLKPMVIIHQQHPIKICRWDPNSPFRMVWCCGSGYVYSWRASVEIPGGIIEAIEVPGEGFVVSSLKWCPDGKGLLLLDNDMFCLGFPVEEDDQFTIHENTASIFSRVR